jgi:hypothetical protein
MSKTSSIAGPRGDFNKDLVAADAATPQTKLPQLSKPRTRGEATFDDNTPALDEFIGDESAANQSALLPKIGGKGIYND